LRLKLMVSKPRRSKRHETPLDVRAYKVERVLAKQKQLAYNQHRAEKRVEEKQGLQRSRDRAKKARAKRKADQHAEKLAEVALVEIRPMRSERKVHLTVMTTMAQVVPCDQHGLLTFWACKTGAHVRAMQKGK